VARISNYGQIIVLYFKFIKIDQSTISKIRISVEEERRPKTRPFMPTPLKLDPACVQTLFRGHNSPCAQFLWSHL
jgi:hypothetical protein